jgi:hypothetical protein
MTAGKGPLPSGRMKSAFMFFSMPRSLTITCSVAWAKEENKRQILKKAINFLKVFFNVVSP